MANSQAPLLQLVSEETVSQLSVHLYQILRLLACPICDKFFVNPIGLACNHRFCERCVMVRREKGDLDCFVCKKSHETTSFRTQSQLKIYISKLKLLLDNVFQGNLPQISQLREFVHSRKQFSEIKNPDKETANESILLAKDDQLHDLDNTVDNCENQNFKPQLSSTSVKPRNPRTPFFNLEETILANRENIIDETMDNEIISIEQDPVHVKCINETIVAPKLTTTIESAPSSQFSIPSTMETDESSPIEENTVLHVSRENPLNISEPEDELPMVTSAQQQFISSTEDNYQTQSQYHLLKQPITYSHKAEDKFDRIIKSSERSEQTESSKLEKTSDGDINRTARSSSPEVYSSLGDFSDDSLIFGTF